MVGIGAAEGNESAKCEICHPTNPGISANLTVKVKEVLICIAGRAASCLTGNLYSIDDRGNPPCADAEMHLASEIGIPRM